MTNFPVAAGLMNSWFYTILLGLNYLPSYWLETAVLPTYMTDKKSDIFKKYRRP